MGLSANYQKLSLYCYRMHNTLNAIMSIITLSLCLLTHFNQDKDEHRDKVVRPGYSVLIGQAEQVHNCGAHAQDALYFISWGLIGVDGPDLSLCWGPRCLLQIHLHRFTQRLNAIFLSLFLTIFWDVVQMVTSGICRALWLAVTTLDRRWMCSCNSLE